MAIDTAEKRYAMLNFGSGATVHMLPEVDGAVDADDRSHLLDLYSGISLASSSLGGDLQEFDAQMATLHEFDAQVGQVVARDAQLATLKEFNVEA